MAENRTLKEYSSPNATIPQSGIACLTVEANNFKLKPSFLSMVQQNQLSGTPTDDPNIYLSIFLEYCDTLKMNGMTSDAIRLRLFLWSLRDIAIAWLHSLPSGFISTWDQLKQTFIVRYFLPSKTADLRNQITSFSQKEGHYKNSWDL
ncbi:uncharacterized protein [Cicer arietinum]|uniref:uncharacterized protein n=1 Tax=Cicer arietinum TaxID=3827 RepID=UPI003CC52A22